MPPAPPPLPSESASVHSQAQNEAIRILKVRAWKMHANLETRFLVAVLGLDAALAKCLGDGLPEAVRQKFAVGYRELCRSAIQNTTNCLDLLDIVEQLPDTAAGTTRTELSHAHAILFRTVPLLARATEHLGRLGQGLDLDELASEQDSAMQNMLDALEHLGYDHRLIEIDSVIVPAAKPQSRRLPPPPPPPAAVVPEAVADPDLCPPGSVLRFRLVPADATTAASPADAVKAQAGEFRLLLTTLARHGDTEATPAKPTVMKVTAKNRRSNGPRPA